jgi:nickel transport protein
MYIFTLLLLGFAALSHAHELEATVTMAAPAVVIRAAYGGTEPVPFAKVQVLTPSEPPQEFQAGRTDSRGYFSFVPERGGNWSIVLDDEEGHRNTVTVPVPEPFEARIAHAPAAGMSRIERAVLGLALLFGLTGFLYGFKARRRPEA